MIKQQIVNEIHKTARKNYTRRNVSLKGIDDLWQADLIDFNNLKKYNKGFTYILVVIDCFSKFAWAIPTKTKSKCEIATAFKGIITRVNRHPVNLQTDFGKEFYNDEFKKVTSQFNINHYSTYSVKKASIVERLIKTLKGKLYKHFSLNGSYRWIGPPLDSVVKLYNNSVHRIIKFKPVEVTSTNEKIVLSNIKNSHSKILISFKKRVKKKLSVGNNVRISKYKSTFDKGYTPNWSTEIFKIRKVNNGIPITYKIEDLNGRPILGTFYEQELQKVKYPDVYLIEKIIRRKGNKLYVKWLGLGDEENSWIDKKEIV